MSVHSNGGFHIDSFKMLAESESKSFWFNARNKLVIYNLKKYFPEMKNYLEIGCGTGFVLKAVSDAFPYCKINGSELFEEGLAYARERVPNANLIQLDAANMTNKDQFDVFGAFDVLEHINEDEKVMKHLYNALKDVAKINSGGGVITVPQHMFMWSSADDSACHVRRYSQKELREKLERAGFNIIYMSGFVSLLFPFMMVSRLIGGKTKEKKVGTELQLPYWMNSIFAFVMKIEFVLLRIGIRFPFGGSIIAVVRK